ncbi:MAG TPA: hypothetical protein VIA62_20755 [Thermoanaerobaculia bacterium]|nr:hypothetical protein [Thermoanaerobaculia bacterium]
MARPAPGGVFILETPNPVSVVVAARNFWLDPTHVRPVHPESLKPMYELAGFDPVERLDLRPLPGRAGLRSSPPLYPTGSQAGQGKPLRDARPCPPRPHGHP